MDFWRWLTSPDGVPVLVGIIGVLGTITAVAATVITQLVVEKRVKDREIARFDWERERQQADAAAAERARFEDVKRQAFADYLYYAEAIAADLDGVTSTFLNPILFVDNVRTLRDMDRNREELKRRTHVILLIAPELAGLMKAVNVRKHSVPRGRFQIPEMNMREYRLALSRVRSAMQESLSIEAKPLTPHTRAPSDDAPMNGDKQITT